MAKPTVDEAVGIASTTKDELSIRLSLIQPTIKDTRSFTIAAYTKLDRKNPISNILKISAPGI